MLTLPNIEFKIRHHHFKASILTVLLILFGAFLLARLGFWQIHRGQAKATMLKSFTERKTQPPLALSDLSFPLTKAYRFRPLTLRGKLLTPKSFLLDNQVYQGKPGYAVITPLQPENSTQWVLINRGWIPYEGNRILLPNLKPTPGHHTLTGEISIPNQKPFILKDTPLPIQWPKRIQHILYPKLSTALKNPLQPFVVKLTSKGPFTFQPLPSVMNIRPARHYGYAVQWFAFALTLIIGFIAANISSNRE